MRWMLVHWIVQCVGFCGILYKEMWGKIREGVKGMEERNMDWSIENIKKVIDKEYGYLKVYKPEDGEEYEVTESAIDSFLKYPHFSSVNWEKNGQKGKCRRQRKTQKGFYLKSTSGENCIDVVGDCLTSLKAIFPEQSNFGDEYKKLRNIYKFLYHSIGNFFPIPEGTNAEGTWAGNCGKNDNFSYKLHQIYDMFKIFEILEKKSNSDKTKYVDKTTLEACKEAKNKHEIDYWIEKGGRSKFAFWIMTEWVDKNKTWNDYVKENYFDDYVDAQMIPLNFSGDNLYIKKSDMDKEEVVIEAIKLCINLIIKRGYRIVYKKEISADEFKKVINMLYI